jgi:hypothetical protein
MGQVELVMVQLLCNNMDMLFIDSFMVNLNECMMSKDCSELASLLSEAQDTATGEADAGAPPNMFEECAFSAAVTAEPEQANKDFQDHYCDYVIECVPEVTSRTECEALFEIEELGIYMVLDDPYITQADDCVNPQPECDDPDVETCLATVGATVGALLSLGGK